MEVNTLAKGEPIHKIGECPIEIRGVLMLTGLTLM
jgi:hypothetical protein